ncbi:MAG: hypothetical protein ACK4HJ_22535 [Acidovorax sp.]
MGTFSKVVKGCADVAQLTDGRPPCRGQESIIFSHRCAKRALFAGAHSVIWQDLMQKPVQALVLQALAAIKLVVTCKNWASSWYGA